MATNELNIVIESVSAGCATPLAYAHIQARDNEEVFITIINKEGRVIKGEYKPDTGGREVLLTAMLMLLTYIEEL